MFKPDKVERYDAGELLDQTRVVWAEDYDALLEQYKAFAAHIKECFDYEPVDFSRPIKDRG